MKRRIVTTVEWENLEEWLGVLSPEFQNPLDRERAYNPWPAKIIGLEAVGIGDEGFINITISSGNLPVNVGSINKIMEVLKLGLQIPGLVSSVLSPANGLFNIKFKVPSRGFCYQAIHIVSCILIGFGYNDLRAPRVAQRTQVFVENNDPKETQVGEWVPYGEYLMQKYLKDLRWQQ